MKKASRRLFSREGLRASIARALLGSAGIRVAGMGLGFLVGVQLARGLGAEGYGTYGLAMSVIAMLMVPTEFGLPQLLTREIASAHTQKDWPRIKGVLRWGTRVSMVSAAVIAAATISWLLLFSDGLSSQLGLTLLAGVVMIPLVAQVSMRSAALRGMQEIVKGELPDVLLRPLLYSMLLFATTSVIGPLNPPLAMALGAGSACIALVAVTVLLQKSLPPTIDRVTALSNHRSWWLSTIPMAATNGLGILRGNLLVLMLGAMVTVSEVGHFRIASSIIGVVLFPVSIFNIVAAPYIASLHTLNNPDALKKLLFFVSAGSALGIFLLSLPFFVAGDWLVASLFGEEFTPAVNVILILCIGLFVSNLFGGNVVLLNMTGHHGDVLLVSTISLALLAVISYFLVSEFSLSGAAIAFVVSNIASDVLMWVAARKRLEMGSSVFLLAVFLKTKETR